MSKLEVDLYIYVSILKLKYMTNAKNKNQNDFHIHRTLLLSGMKKTDNEIIIIGKKIGLTFISIER